MAGASLLALLDGIASVLDDVARRQRAAGAGILLLAPWLMKGLSIAGTAAMFLVGGGILTHGIPAVQRRIEALAGRAGDLPWRGSALETLGAVLLDALFGIVAGAIALAVGSAVRRVRPAQRTSRA